MGVECTVIRGLTQESSLSNSAVAAEVSPPHPVLAAEVHSDRLSLSKLSRLILSAIVALLGSIAYQPVPQTIGHFILWDSG